ncbi:MAG TPA: redoxin domain-containing protein [Candidatus Binatia bacterium]|nr:redoxin domain-containing protein [Candidatus Binatia bacterium]
MDWGVQSRRLWISIVLAGSGLAHAQQAFDLEGRSASPLAQDSGKVVVLVFLRRDCPVSARYAPSIQQISKRYANAAKFFLVYPDKNDNAQDIRKSVQEYGYRLPVLRDPEHALVRLSRVQITPEVAVFDHDRHLVYDGRIDDWYIDLGRARPAPTTHELDDAIRAALAGKTLPRAEVRGVGCYISDLE